MKRTQLSQWPGLRLALGLLSVLVTSTMPSAAADRTWNGAGDGTTMNSGDNWVGGVAPVAGDALFFGGSTGLAVNNNYAANTTFAGITFNSDAGAFTFSGNAINMVNSAAPNPGITNNSASLQTFGLVINLNGAHRSWHLVGDITHTASVNGGGSTPNPQSVFKYGPGTLTMAGTTDNGFGSVVVNGGTVVLAKTSSGSVHALGGYTRVHTNGVLIISGTGGDQIFERTPLQIDGGVLRVQTNELVHIVRGTNSDAGIIENGLAGTTNVLTIGGNNGAPHGIFRGTVRDGAAGVLSLAVIRNNTVLQLDGTNTYSGATTISETVNSGSARLLVNGAHIGGGDYNVSGNAVANQGVLGGAGRISASAVNINANGVIAPGGFAPDGDSSVFSATTAILTFSNAVNLTTASSTLDLGLNSTTVGSGYDQVVIAGSGSFSNNSANLKLTLGYTPSPGDKFTIVKVEGTSSASTVGTFASLNGVATDLSQGAIFLEPSTGKRFQISYRAEGTTFDAGAGAGNDIMLEVIADAGATLTWRGDGVNNIWDAGTTANWWDGASLVVFTTNNPVIFDNSGSNQVPVNITEAVATPTVTFNATNHYVIAGAGSLTGLVSINKTNTGTVSVVSATDGLTGPTVIRGGILQIGTNGTTGSWSGNVTVNSNGVFGFNRSDDVTYTTPTLSGTGGFVHSGSGKLTINTALAFAGRTTNSGGVLQLGDGVGNTGSIGGDVNVSGTNVLRYFYPGSSVAAYTIANTVSGNGTVLWEQPENPTTSCFYSIPTSLGSSNFTGTHIVGAAVTVHALNDHVGYSLGSNSVVIVTNLYSQVWLDRTPVAYNQSYIIAGSGTPIIAPGGTDVTPPYGVIKLFQNTISGTITMVGNSRIGGSSTGGSLLGQIIGNGHDLEIFGDNLVNPFILSVSNSLNNWGNTAVLFGSLRALSSGAISTNAMTIDLNGQLHTFGNTVTVSSLQDGPNGAGVVYNLNNSVAGTLVVGGDNSSSAFNGTFGNGGTTRALNLTKVGSGTLTLSAISTNTGAITVNGGTLALTGSGSFDNATNFAVATGATLDVSTRNDGTLTLTANQTLKHSGALVGAITINGSLNLGSGNVLLGLNRANTPATNDSVVVSGTVTGGGTLTVTNLGPALQVGNTFQLFAAGVSGITANLPTVDVLNGVTYTWNNNIASSGAISVASVTPIGQPTLNVGQVGNTLTFSWTGPFKLQSQTNSLSVGLSSNWGNYPGGSISPVNVTINPANPTVFFRLSLQ